MTARDLLSGEMFILPSAVFVLLQRCLRTRPYVFTALKYLEWTEAWRVCGYYPLVWLWAAASRAGARAPRGGRGARGRGVSRRGGGAHAHTRCDMWRLGVEGGGKHVT